MKGAGAHANLTVGYLEHGLGWTPSYLISLQDEKTAQITMQSVLVNDAEDLKNADLFFVVGVPNFAYANIPSPMALQQSLLDFMQAASRENEAKSARYSNALSGQAIGGLLDFEAPAAPGFSTTVGELPGTQEEDLFLYSRKNVTLAKGERAVDAEPALQLHRQPRQLSRRQRMHGLDVLWRRHLRHPCLVLYALLGYLKRDRAIQNRLAVLDRHHPPRGKRAAIAGAFHAVDNRGINIAGAQEIRM